MSFRLSDSDVERIERATRLLLAPHDHPTLDAWRGAVNRELTELLNADSAGFLLPGADGPAMFSEEHDPAALARFPELLPPDLSDGTPIWSRHLALGVSTVAMAYGTELRRYHDSAYYNDFAAPNGAADTLGASLLLPGGTADGPGAAASLHLWRERAGGRHAFGRRELAMLRLLLPAFRAGVEARRRYAAAPAALLSMLDQLGQAVMLCDHRGRVLHRTPTLEAMLAADPEAAAVVRAMRRVAMRASDSTIVQAQAARSLVRTNASSYDVSLIRYAEPARGEPWLLVSLVRASRREPTQEELRSRFGLTPAEARVALLLARGRSNAEIAERLAISPFTARRHTERVLAKLHVRARAEVASTLY